METGPYPDWVFAPRQPRRLSPGKARMNIMRCPCCKEPVVFVYHQEKARFVTVKLVDADGKFIYDMNPIYDKTKHKFHFPSFLVAQAVRKRLAARTGSEAVNDDY